MKMLETLRWLIFLGILNIGINIDCSYRKGNQNILNISSLEILENKRENKESNNAEGIVRIINYHYKAALKREEPVLRCSPEYEDFKLLLIDGAYCLAEKKYDFAIKNFKQALIEAEKIDKKNTMGALFYFLGLSYEGKNLLNKATKSYNKSYKLNKRISYERGCKMAQDALERLRN